MQRRKRAHRRAWLCRLLLLFGILGVGIFLIDRQLRPVVQSFAAYQAKSYATDVVNDAILYYTQQEHLTYDKFSEILYDEDHKIIGIEANSVAINTFKANIVKKINEGMAQLEMQNIQIPVGSLLGTQILQGVGPKVNLRVQPATYVESEVVDQFDSAGINQTRHQMVLKVNISLTAVIPGYITTTEFTTSYPLVETVIVGAAPSQFTHVTGDESSTIGKINDYANRPQQQ
ncbi:sporulation protein YunB [Neobittarella massiliensis]|uniref:Sporulation protein YunB n=2 Tax=Oscillospiraceae TaxID=216572 RepID=A0A8J6ILA2_9FIRM|nr:sporulation protein YunB [Neobittarella massiliensis]MBC3515729.1 sporulation protein YunB [Neobittarella massiliensis]SCJ47976.1 sporulation protein YunB [uncultured Anaerotruncus sp.]